MRSSHLVWACLFSVGTAQHAFAQEQSSTSITNDVVATQTVVSAESNADTSTITTEQATTPKHPRLEALKDLKNVTKNDLKVNATAAQPDAVKDPLQPLNREIYAFNNSLDENIVRPIAVQYKAKVPEDVRGSYSSFRKNLSEPWNAVNQLAQGRFKRAAKSLGRFTINTISSLGFADPASRLGLSLEEESLGTTLGYYGVPSGPYLMLPILGPSTLRHSADYIVDGYANPMTYAVDNPDQALYTWGNRVLGGINTRAKLLDVEDVLQGDRYSAIRDIYLQRVAFNIAEKQGKGSEAVSFVDDDDSDQDSSSDSTSH